MSNIAAHSIFYFPPFCIVMLSVVCYVPCTIPILGTSEALFLEKVDLQEYHTQAFLWGYECRLLALPGVEPL